MLDLPRRPLGPLEQRGGGAVRRALLLATLLLASERSVTAAVAHLASTTGSAQASSLSVARPAGTAAGNVLLANIVELSGTTAATSSGWTQLTFATFSSSTARRMTTLYKIATASEPASYTFAATGATSMIGSVSAFSGTDATAPIAATGTPSVQGSLATVAATAVTTLAAGSGVVFLSGVGVAVSHTNTSWSTATGGAMTEIVDTTQNDLALGTAFSVQATAGTTGAGTATLSGPGWNIGVLIALAPAATTVNTTAAGTATATATAGSCSSISVSAPYANDGNGNNSLSYRTRTPTGTGTWVGPNTRTHGASPYAFSVTGLAAGTYDVEVTYVDADGVTGTAVQTVSNISVGLNCTTTAAPTATAGSCSQVTVSAPFTGNANGNGSTAFARGTWSERSQKQRAPSGA